MPRGSRSGIAVIVVLLCAVVIAGYWLFTPKNDDTGHLLSSATVQHVVDGDTLYVLLDGERTKVRLLNVDAPELTHGDQPGQCFGQEASRYLSKKLPKGSTIQLAFDVERYDRYGRTLAWVTLEEESINESLVASGHAKAMKVEPNVQFYAQLLTAQKQAQRDNAGMFSPAHGCH
ncbi:thermonuclease family protein [Paeniglutamicibacter psychrophenolicus]|uniref:thermonuclease family protein n=1 Tax=Paeniglutamicibacter psychrophenolicus TaxID=257454 RepID=UPI002784403E|nr:thermonuclease family protein [Paeniglutamicibacter psychrophenolicus]MDQ0094219.1 micrococcal nuclease [Paeniglutamicibacter psychrophenolicus]